MILDIEPSHAAIVKAILAAHLPPGVRVFAFGSRAAGTAKPLSDLDLSLEGEAPLPLSLMAEMSEAFEESDLPWKVDLVDRASVSPAFGRIIDAGKLPLT